jgi:hypothetical protein
MGPLVSLLKAHIVREEFLRTNRDLLDTFGILARGEQLLVSNAGADGHIDRFPAALGASLIMLMKIQAWFLTFSAPQHGEWLASPCMVCSRDLAFLGLLLCAHASC